MLTKLKRRMMMSAVKLFECANCEAYGKVVIKNDDILKNDVVFCPVCGADLMDEVDEELDLDE